MSPIKDFKVKYEAVNKENEFSAGDTIKGTVTFTLTEETKIKCLFVKAKGDANVHWTEGEDESYYAHKRYYKAKEFLVAENKDGTVLSSGNYCYQFKLKVPEGNIPPSFKGKSGKVVHVLEAKMSRSWHTSTTDKMDLNFVTRTFLPIGQSPQAGSVDKSVGMFSKGGVHLSATVNKRICSPGDTLYVTAKITNNSSKKMKIKFKIDEKIVYRASHNTTVEHGNVCKIVGETIERGFEGDVSCEVTVPPDTRLSILNCEIINVEFYLKVYLDISFASDPEVVLPLIIAAPGALAQHGYHGFPHTSWAEGGPSSSDFPPPFLGPPNAYAYPPPGPYPNPDATAACSIWVSSSAFHAEPSAASCQYNQYSVSTGAGTTNLHVPLPISTSGTDMDKKKRSFSLSASV